jgi:hypothetical protein
MMEDRFLKRLRKKARKGLRGWPIATVAFYGPNLADHFSLAFTDIGLSLAASAAAAGALSSGRGHLVGARR